MKKMLVSALAVFLVTVSFLNVACAGDQPSAGEEVTLTGSVNEENRFVDENGQTYELAVSQKAMEMRALPGQKIEIKGTVIEQDGQKIVSIIDYKLLNN